jgi:hypothetical protein
MDDETPEEKRLREEQEFAGDRRSRARDGRRHAMDSASRLPSFTEIWGFE